MKAPEVRLAVPAPAECPAAPAKRAQTPEARAWGAALQPETTHRP